MSLLTTLLAPFGGVSSVSPKEIDGDYTIQPEDARIAVDGSNNNVILTLPPITDPFKNKAEIQIERIDRPIGDNQKVLSVTSLTQAGGVATVTTSTAHNLDDTINTNVGIHGSTNGFDRINTNEITVTSTNTFTYSISDTLPAVASRENGGTIIGAGFELDVNVYEDPDNLGTILSIPSGRSVNRFMYFAFAFQGYLLGRFTYLTSELARDAEEDRLEVPVAENLPPAIQISVQQGETDLTSVNTLIKKLPRLR